MICESKRQYSTYFKNSLGHQKFRFGLKKTTLLSYHLTAMVVESHLLWKCKECYFLTAIFWIQGDTTLLQERLSPILMVGGWSEL